MPDVEENEAVTTEAEALADILAWSQDRPLWQRDALHHFTEAEELTEADLQYLANERAGIAHEDPEDIEPVPDLFGGGN